MGITCWFKGYIVCNGQTMEGTEAAKEIVAQLAPNDHLLDCKTPIPNAKNFLHPLDGNFAFAITEGSMLFAAVDRMRSIPLFLSWHEDTLHIYDQALRLVEELNLIEADVEASLEIAMSGYSLGDRTLYKNLRQLCTGELLLFHNGALNIERYYLYRPWRIDHNSSEQQFLKRLTEVTEGIFKKMIAGLSGRPVMLPLSAGLDSRLVASALVHHGCKNITCYAYGRVGNFEARKSQEIAKQLNLPWLFIPFSPRRVRKMINSEIYAEYMKFSDSCSGPPFLQDFLAIVEMHRQGLVPPDAVFINGNSGDFITGGHIPESLHTPVAPDVDKETRLSQIITLLQSKQFSLWDDLCTAENNDITANRLREMVNGLGLDENWQQESHAVYEALECQSRQSKFVISGQRVYEFFDYDWRLPLWDNEYLDFWETVPIALKKNQLLYRAMLEKENFGGVWDKVDVKEYTCPRWLAPIRIMAKILCAPFGRDRWRKIDKRVFFYWTNILSTYSIASYRRILFGRQGFRNAISVRCESYLAEKGRHNDGSPISTPTEL